MSIAEKYSELIRLLFLLALETEIVTVLPWDRGQGELVQRRKGTLK